MKRYAIPFTLLLLTSTPSWAQPDKEWKSWFGHFQAGYATLEGNASNLVEDDLFLAGGATYAPSHWKAGLLMELGYSDFDIRREILDTVDAPNGDVEIWWLTPGLLWSPKTSGKVGFHLVGAAGVYRLEGKLTEPGFFEGIICDPWWWWCYPGIVPGDRILARESSTEFGWNAGLGITFEIGLGSELFFEARYHRIETDVPTEMIPFSVGYRW